MMEEEKDIENSEPGQNNVWETFFATTDSGVLRHTVDGRRILAVNPAALEILGYESENEMMAEGFDLIAASVLDEDKPKLRESIRKLKKVGDSTSVDYRVQHKNGEIRNVIGRIKLLEEDGELIYQRFLMDCTAQKLQEKKEQAEKEKQYLEMVEALSIDFDAVFYLNLDTGTGFAYRMNEEMEQKFSAEFGLDLTGEMQLRQNMDFYIDKFVYQDDRETFRSATTKESLKEKLLDKPVLYLTYRTFRNRKITYYQMKVVRVGSWQERHNAVVGFCNVDEEVRGEKEQKKILADALVQAERASKAKTAFLNNMSHDIRTPMHAIIGFTSLAYSHVTEAELIKGYLEKIMSSSDHLLSLINDVLDMSSIESGKVKLDEKECNLPRLVHESADMMMPDVENGQLQMKVEIINVENENVICDKLRLNQVLINCLNNAIKFTKPGGSVGIRLQQTIGTSKDHGTYVFQIYDTGIGMSPDFMQHIFEPFEKERSSTVSGTSGTGLGMAITKNIVDMMGGSIQAESQEGKGSEFTIYLQFPLADNEEVVKQPLKEIPTGNFSGRHILLVEDLELNREIAEVILMEAGFQVTSVQNGQEAVDAIEQAEGDEYDLILMDIQMPVMDGYEASRRIRSMSDPHKAEIPILAMTANAFREDKHCAYEAGMNGHLTKPIQVEELCQAIEKQIEQNSIRLSDN
jgi:PAS domain S-box-containing protein